MERTDFLRLRSIIAYCDDIDRQFERSDNQLLWNTATDDIPKVKAICTKLIAEARTD